MDVIYGRGTPGGGSELVVKMAQGRGRAKVIFYRQGRPVFEANAVALVTEIAMALANHYSWAKHVKTLMKGE